MRFHCHKCEETFDTNNQIPCPDGLEGCGVYHRGPANYVCTYCGYDHGPEYKAAWAKYKEANPDAITWPVKETIGIYAGNLAGIKKLELFTGHGPERKDASTDSLSTD